MTATASEARIAANRANALKSTGPTTRAGKERSRANALKHGLCSTVVVAEDAELVRARTADLLDTIKPRDEFQRWLVAQIALVSLRIERCEQVEGVVRDRVALQAELSWDEDRRREAAVLGQSLGKRPDLVVEQLRRTVQGCEWMMGRWAMLACSADAKGRWTAEQEALAFDLLGTPREFREGHAPGTVIDLQGRVIEAAADPAAVARRQVAALEERREQVAQLDAVDRSMAEAGLDDDAPELRRVRRYEATLHGRLRWCLAQLRIKSPDQETAPPPPPEPSPEADPPSMTVEEVDNPMAPAGRRAKRLRKAESRREARRRKHQRRRA
jgi:hypothetical protein